MTCMGHRRLKLMTSLVSSRSVSPTVDSWWVYVCSVCWQRICMTDPWWACMMSSFAWSAGKHELDEESQLSCFLWMAASWFPLNSAGILPRLKLYTNHCAAALIAQFDGGLSFLTAEVTSHLFKHINMFFCFQQTSEHKYEWNASNVGSGSHTSVFTRFYERSCRFVHQPRTRSLIMLMRNVWL